MLKNKLEFLLKNFQLKDTDLSNNPRIHIYGMNAVNFLTGRKMNITQTEKDKYKILSISLTIETEGFFG